MFRARSSPKSQFCKEFVKGKGIFFGGPPGGVRERSRRDPGGEDALQLEYQESVVFPMYS